MGLIPDCKIYWVKHKHYKLDSSHCLHLDHTHYNQLLPDWPQAWSIFTCLNIRYMMKHDSQPLLITRTTYWHYVGFKSWKNSQTYSSKCNQQLSWGFEYNWIQLDFATNVTWLIISVGVKVEHRGGLSQVKSLGPHPKLKYLQHGDLVNSSDLLLMYGVLYLA